MPLYIISCMIEMGSAYLYHFNLWTHSWDTFMGTLIHEKLRFRSFSINFLTSH